MTRYIETVRSGKIHSLIQAARDILKSCVLCPRRCRVDRASGQTGLCQTGSQAIVADYSLHFGEEAPLVGQGGSGTIFFAGCNLLCCFCQNYEISHDVHSGLAAKPENLAAIMLDLQQKGALNINFVTPSHVVPQILESLPLAVDLGLTLPLVYNTSAYDSLGALRLLDGVIDIYMPDVKFESPDSARKYLNASDYPDRAKEAVKEMHKQVGDLRINDYGIAEQGLLVRHLVMPENLAGTKQWMDFLAQEISPDTYINIMDQYRPCGLASNHPEINRCITAHEYKAAKIQAFDSGLHRLDDRSGHMKLLRIQKLF